MESSLIETPTSRSGDEVIEELTVRISELEEANANLQLLDEAMRRNNALFEAVLANSWQGITLTGPDRRILKVVRGLTGRSAPELRGVLIESLAIPEDHEIIVEVWVYLLEVTRVARSWPEKATRLVRWFTPTEAVRILREPLLIEHCRKLEQQVSGTSAGI